MLSSIASTYCGDEADIKREPETRPNKQLRGVGLCYSQSDAVVSMAGVQESSVYDIYVVWSKQVVILPEKLLDGECFSSQQQDHGQ